MRGLATQSLAFLAGALLALPPSACCLIGAGSCCARAKVEAAPVRSCCQHHAAQSPSKACCQYRGDQSPAQAPTSPQLCCCVKTAVPVGSAVSVSHDFSLNTFAVVEPMLVSAAANSGILVAPICDTSPPLHVRLCVWRC